jgi:hypothetical protein
MLRYQLRISLVDFGTIPRDIRRNHWALYNPIRSKTCTETSTLPTTADFDTLVMVVTFISLISMCNANLFSDKELNAKRNVINAMYLGWLSPLRPLACFDLSVSNASVAVKAHRVLE